MEKKKKRSLEEIFVSLKDAEKEFDEKLEKYGLKDIKPPKEEVKEKSDNIENQDVQVDETSNETNDNEGA